MKKAIELAKSLGKQITWLKMEDETVEVAYEIEEIQKQLLAELTLHQCD